MKRRETTRRGGNSAAALLAVDLLDFKVCGPVALGMVTDGEAGLTSGLSEPVGALLAARLKGRASPAPTRRAPSPPRFRDPHRGVAYAHQLSSLRVHFEVGVLFESLNRDQYTSRTKL